MSSEKYSVHEAIKNQDLDLVRKILDSDGTLARLLTSWGEPPLTIAVQENHYEIVQTLLEYGADVNATDNDKMTPLHYAAEHTDARIGKLLISAGADCNKYNDLHYQPLHIAARNNNVKLIHALLKSSASIDAQGENGWTPLFYAVSDGSVEAVQVLITQGSDIEHQDSDNCTPLHLSFDVLPPNGSAILGLLLQSGAHLDAYTAVRLGQSHIIRLMLKENPDLISHEPHGIDFLSLAVSTKQRELVHMLLEYGADPNDCEHCQLPLLEALNIRSSNDSEKMVKLLLAHGADPLVKKDPKTKSPYEWAKQNREELLGLLE